MTYPPITYGSLFQYFHTAALGQSRGGVSAGQIASALGGILGRGASTGSFNYGTSPLQQSISASLGEAQRAVDNAKASAARLDEVNSRLSQLGKIAGTLAPSNSGSKFGDAASLPSAGSTSTQLPDTLQGNINRAQRAISLPPGQQGQDRTAADVRFNALRSQAQQLVSGLQGVRLSDPARQQAFDTALDDLRGALAGNASDPNRVRALSFSPAAPGSATSAGTFDASVQGTTTGTPVGRASARAAVDRLGQAIGAAQAALAPDRATAHSQVGTAQGLVSQFTKLQGQANNGSFSLGGGSSGFQTGFGYGWNANQLFQFPRSGLLNLYA